MKTDQQIEQEIQAKGLTAPRVTREDIERNIAAQYFFTAQNGVQGADPHLAQYSDKSLDLLTFCVLVMRNGFTVTGESACASPENFDAEIGRAIARNNAIEKLWPLEGYLLKDRLYKDSFPDIEQQPVKTLADSISDLA